MLPLLALAALSTGNQPRVATATLPIPMKDGGQPVTPDRLRSESPWTLSLAGDWRFKLTHGQIIDGQFALSEAELIGLKASSSESANPMANAFDGDPKTRWCAAGGNFPQSLQAKLDAAPRVVTAVEIAWERPAARYTCRIEGSNDGLHWQTLLDRSALPGIGDGLLTVTPNQPVRYVRVVVLGASGGSWASIRELKIHFQKSGQDVVWKPAKPSRTVLAHADDFVAPQFDDRAWKNLAVPANWEMAGYSIPTYNSVDDTVGLYRRWIDVPKAWNGRKIVWRFDGALDGAEIYINGRRAGYHESGYTAFDVDLTGQIKPGQRNLFAVRLSKTTPSVECETGDYQSMGGIYRDTRLIAVPPTHVADLTVRTPLANNYRDAKLQVAVNVQGSPGEKLQITGFVTDAATGIKLPVKLAGQAQIAATGQATFNLSAPVAAPKLWSAEKPALYYLTLDLLKNGKSLERIQQRFGFRQVEIKKSVVLWNGKPIKCTGICRHDFWADKGFALTDAEWKKDLTMMKAANINAIRTSHYNHAARFLELCDERGFYILDEVPFCWVDDRVKDPKFAPPLLQRAAETVARDKNRPCILAWSLGNENPVGIDTQKVHDLVARLDPTRPSFASGAGPNNVKGQELFDTHYPSPESVTRYVEKDSGIAPEVITEHPHTFYSEETQTYDPGASDAWSEGLIATWDQMWRSPTLLGSFIWEWQNQGIADRFPDRATDFYYGLDHMRQENNKGIVTAYRKPKAELWIVKMVYSPVQIPTRTFRYEQGAYYVVPIQNRYAFTDLKELKIRWTAFAGKEIVGQGTSTIACPPGQTVNAKIVGPSRTTDLDLSVERADGTNVTIAHLTPPDAVPPSPPAANSVDNTWLNIHQGADTLDLDNKSQQVRFDRKTGTLFQWIVNDHPIVEDGAYLNLGEAKTAKGDNYYRASQSPVTDHARLTTENNSDGSFRVTSRSEIHASADNTAILGRLTVVYVVKRTAEIAVSWNVDWTAPATNLWEVGLCLPIPKEFDRQSWSREAYFTAYPDGHIGAPNGTAGPKDPAFAASKRSLNFLTLTNRNGIGLALIASGMPLIGRARNDGKTTTIFASREIAAAGPDDLSQSWFHAHDIHAAPGNPLSGEFLLRAVTPSKH